MILVRIDGERVERLPQDLAEWARAYPGERVADLELALHVGRVALDAARALAGAPPPPPSSIAWPAAPPPPPSRPPAHPPTAPRAARPSAQVAAWADDEAEMEGELGPLPMADPAPPAVVQRALAAALGGPPTPAPQRSRGESPEQQAERIRRYRRPVPPLPGEGVAGGIELPPV